MLLSKLLEKTEYQVINGREDIEINHLVYDSRKVEANDVFVCIRGVNSDGHQFAQATIEAGAVAIITDSPISMTPSMEHATIIRCKDSRETLAHMSAAYFDYPAQRLFTIGITGTKGKTTTTYMVREILEACNIKAGLIGTIETLIGDRRIPSANTTPESYKVQEYFQQMVEAGCQCVVMEVSSQALMLHRTAGIMFDIGVFTNLEADHIGPNEHTSFEHYMECKSKLFQQCKIGIINQDSPYAAQMIKGCSCGIETYGLQEGADLQAVNIQYRHENGKISTSYDVLGQDTMHVDLNLPGEFSVYNSLCAIGITRHFQVPQNLLEQALRTVKVAGRVEPVPVSSEFVVMIDYAHNALSLKSLLTTLREYRPKRMITLFGSVGGRTQLRRGEMGEISGELSDFTIITSDNPGFEDPEAIMKDIEAGVQKYSGNYIKIADRRDAVRYAILNAQPGDMVILAGKGHETYQEINGVKHPMSDRELALEAKKELV